MLMVTEEKIPNDAVVLVATRDELDWADPEEIFPRQPEGIEIYTDGKTLWLSLPDDASECDHRNCRGTSLRVVSFPGHADFIREVLAERVKEAQGRVASTEEPIMLHYTALWLSKIAVCQYELERQYP